jgi:hypothetical protein
MAGFTTRYQRRTPAALRSVTWGWAARPATAADQLSDGGEQESSPADHMHEPQRREEYDDGDHLRSGARLCRFSHICPLRRELSEPRGQQQTEPAEHAQ